MKIGNLFKGRIDRKQFLIGHAYIFLAGAIFCILMTFVTMPIFGAISSKSNYSMAMVIGAVILFLLFVVVVTVVSIGLNIRRWHDLDMTGWLTLLSYIPYVNFAVLIYLLVMKGKSEPNEFGDASNGSTAFSVLFPIK